MLEACAGLIVVCHNAVQDWKDQRLCHTAHTAIKVLFATQSCQRVFCWHKSDQTGTRAQAKLGPRRGDGGIHGLARPPWSCWKETIHKYPPHH